MFRMSNETYDVLSTMLDSTVYYTVHRADCPAGGRRSVWSAGRNMGPAMWGTGGIHDCCCRPVYGSGLKNQYG